MLGPIERHDEMPFWAELIFIFLGAAFVVFFCFIKFAGGFEVLLSFSENISNVNF